MTSRAIDLEGLIDPQELLDGGGQPWTILAFPRDNVDQNGVPADPEAQEYIAVVQSLGVSVGIWIDTPVEGVAYAFVGPGDIGVLNDALNALRDSGRYSEDYANQLTNRLLGTVDPS